MPVITMNVPCKIASWNGSDVYGQPVLSIPTTTVCAVLKIENKRVKTTVRADSSGTRGHADEVVSDIRLLLPKNTNIKLDDIVTVMGVSGRVTSVQPRVNVMGRLDHIQIGATVE